MAVTQNSVTASGTGSTRAIRVYVNVTSAGAVSASVDFYSATPLYYSHMPLHMTGFYGTFDTYASYNSGGGVWQTVWSHSGGTTSYSAAVSAQITTPAVSQSGKTVVATSTTAYKPGGSSPSPTPSLRKPGAPRNFSLTRGLNSDGSRYLKASWNPPTDMGNNGTVTYIVEWDAPEIGSKAREETKNLFYIWNSPWPDLVYNGHVLAYNNSGGSGWSNSSTVTMYSMTHVKDGYYWEDARWWVKQNGVWRKALPWVNKNGKWRNH